MAIANADNGSGLSGDAQRPFRVPQRHFLIRIYRHKLLVLSLVAAGAGAAFLFQIAFVRAGDIINPGRYFEISLRAMGDFDMDQRNGKPSDIPRRFRDLDGKRVSLVGEMWAPKSNGNNSLSYFQLVFTRQMNEHVAPVAQHFVDVNVLPDIHAPNFDGKVRVWGKLHIRILQEEGVIKSIYEVDVDKVVSED